LGDQITILNLPDETRQCVVQESIPRYNLHMSRTAAEILEDARRLPPSEFNWLIGELLQESDGSSEAEIEESWKAEVERRVAASEAGIGATCSWEEVEAPLRARLAK
jgi:putative addiction module component (TIGR02574 family)